MSASEQRLDERIRQICRKEGLPDRQIEVLRGGQVNQVFRVDSAYVLRLGQRENAYQRLQRETTLLRSLSSQIPVPEVLAFDALEGLAYQIQRFVPGQKLHHVWGSLTPAVQEQIAAELAGCLRVLHSRPVDQFTFLANDGISTSSWAALLEHDFQRTLEEIASYRLGMFPGILELAQDYFQQHKHVLAGGVPTLVHRDLTFVNILIDQGHISALLDFEFAMHAPRDFELWAMESFCLYPNDYAEEDYEIFNTADFASFLPMLRQHASDLFAIPHLRRRLDLYHITATLSSWLNWRKANLATIPPEAMAGRDFYMAKICNFIFDHGVRLI